MSLRRIFLAVPVSREIISLQDDLRARNSSLEKIKWTRAHNVHLTMYFIGNIPEEKFNSIVEIIAPLFSLQNEITLSYESVAFAPSGKPRMLWIKYRVNDQFSKLSNAIHQMLTSHGIVVRNDIYQKDPVPHITLARFHSMKNYHGINLGVSENILPAEIKINSCELWESIQTEGKSDYRSVFTFPFNR